MKTPQFFGRGKVSPQSRRNFLTRASAWSALMLVNGLDSNARIEAPKYSADPFSLGVASGDPLPNGVVLWTRLAPDPLNGGGMPRSSVSVKWEIASDEGMKKIVKRGEETASPELGHSVHVEAQGLEPGRWYWYRFMSGSAVSPVGRTKTAPAFNARLDRLRLAVASCQHYEYGYFTPYKHMAKDDLDLVVHLGDYIYEYGAVPNRTRKHNSAEIVSLEDYRNRFGLYKSDPDLKSAHALFPWIVTWDDHEVENNYAGDVSEDNQPREAFLKRRAHAYQAYYEHMPLRKSALPHGPDMLLYRAVRYGDLATFNVLDTRQYRSDQPCGDGTKPYCPEALSPNTTIMGDAQEKWLLKNLEGSKSRWNVLAQQVMMARWDSGPGAEQRFSMDKWAGYPVARDRFLKQMSERKPSNPIVLTGDIHSNWAADLKYDYDDAKAPVIGTEFVGTSITSGGDGLDMRPDVEKQMSENPHVKFFNGQRGYLHCEATPERWKTEYRIVPKVSTPDAEISTRAVFLAEHGKPGAIKG